MVRTVAFLLFLWVTVIHAEVYNLPVGAYAGVSIRIDTAEGTYAVSVEGQTWFTSAPTSLHVGNTWYIAQDSAQHPLVPTNSTMTSGLVNAFGTYSRVAITYQAGTTRFIVGWNVYQKSDMIEFTQEFPDGATHTTLYDPFQVVSGFPSFATTPGQSALPTLSTLTWQSLWDNGTMGTGVNHIYGGLEGGVPVVFWNASEDTPSSVAVLSPLANYLVGYQVPKSRHPDMPAFTCGLTGMLQSIPVGFQHSSVLYFGDSGISDTVNGWGSILLKKSNKQRQYRSDLATSSLGYWTDNGAYYYYHTLTDAPESNYEETMIAVGEYHRQQQLPVAYYQFDSWWYYKASPADGNCTLFDCGGGVQSWTPMPDVFPKGMNYVQQSLGKPLILHNRFWAVNNNYSSQYHFESGPVESLPLDDAFWPYLLGVAKSWNVVTYEQDWLVKQYSAMTQTQNSVSTAITWLQQMGSAAQQLGMSIQYCMPLPQFWLASTEIQAVTHSRVSDDYLHGTNQWDIGKTSLLVWSLGLYPFKDVTWTTGNQPGNPFNLQEYNPQMEVIVSVLTAGPVAFGDGIGMTNRTLLLSTCTNNGTTLGASVPAVPIERYFGASPPQGEVWSSYTELGGYRWAYLLSISLLAEYSIVPNDVKVPAQQDYYVWSYEDTQLANITPFSQQQPLSLQQTPGGTVNGKQYAEFYRVLPVFSNGWTFIGETDKIISVSPVRVSQLHVTPAGFSALIHVTAQEQVHLAVLSPTKQVMHVTCVHSPSSMLVCEGSNCLCNSA